MTFRRWLKYWILRFGRYAREDLKRSRARSRKDKLREFLAPLWALAIIYAIFYFTFRLNGLDLNQFLVLAFDLLRNRMM